MPKKVSTKKIAIGIPEKEYKEIEEYALKQSPPLFLYEVVVLGWEQLKKLKEIKNGKAS